MFPWLYHIVNFFPLNPYFMVTIGRKKNPQPLGVILHFEEEVEKGINIAII